MAATAIRTEWTVRFRVTCGELDQVLEVPITAPTPMAALHLMETVLVVEAIEVLDYGQVVGRCDGCGDFVWEQERYLRRCESLYCADCKTDKPKRQRRSVRNDREREDDE